jgi:hypothetical protein
MTMRIMLLAPLALVACATTADSRAESDAEMAKALEGKTAGASVKCVSLTALTGGPQVIDDRNILYRVSGRRIWRNTLPASCPSLRPYSTIVVEVFGSELCRNDLIRPVTPGSGVPGPMCRLGDFTPYDKPKN